MFINSFFLAISSSIDSFGIGITYGIKNTKISKLSTFILILISLFTSFISVLLGGVLSNILPSNYINLFGGSFLFILGIFVIIKGFLDSNNINNNYYDFNNSNLIDPKEAIFLGLALSVDSLGIGISSGLLNSGSFIFPILVTVFQFTFLNAGILFGKRIYFLCNISNFVWSCISGLLLILIGIIRLI